MKREKNGIAKLLGDRWLHQRVVPTKSHDPAICMMCGERHGMGLPCPELTVMCNGEHEHEEENDTTDTEEAV